MDARTSIKVQALRNALYHGARRNFLEFINRAFSFIVILGGAVAVADYLGNAKPAAFIATVAGTLQLVFDFGGRAKEHAFLQRRFYDVIAEVETCPEPAENQICKWQADLVRIYADEPPTLRALDAIAYNDAAEALDTEWRVRVNWWQSLWRHFYPFNGTSFAWKKAIRPEVQPTE
ncbi:hypothetical protein [Xanthobacter autotrophicus]|uniref:hypothetical protein n=1 Tax=Xanthobacter autotrophicus TaxID=280 RepID=UPI00372C915F